MATVQLTFTRIRGSEARDEGALLLDDGLGRPEIVRIPDATLQALRGLALDLTLLPQGKAAVETAYGEQLCQMLFRSPHLPGVYDYLLPHLGVGEGSLQLLFDIQSDLHELDGVNWELLVGLSRAGAFDALDLGEPHRCIARIVRSRSLPVRRQLKLPVPRLDVVLWTPLGDDPVVRATAQKTYLRLAALGDSVKPVAPPSSDLARLIEQTRDSTSGIMLHIITHGLCEADGEVRIETDQGSRDALGLELQLAPLASALREGRVLGAVLDICHAGAGQRTQDSPGRRLITAGFPFAIATETPLSIDVATCFSAEFYRQLGLGSSVYGAVTRARSEIADALHREPAHHHLAWAGQRLFIDSLLARSSAQPLLRPVVDAQAGTQRPSESELRSGDNVQRLRDQLLPRHLDMLASIEFAVGRLVEDVTFDGVRFGSGHLVRLEQSLDVLGAGLRKAGSGLSREEVLTLLALVQLSPVGWLNMSAQGTADAALRSLLQGLEATAQADAARVPPTDEIAWLMAQLREEVHDITLISQPLIDTLLALAGDLDEVTRPFERAPADSLRPRLLASLFRIAQALDAGVHRLAPLALLADGHVTVERWLHSCSQRGELVDGRLRFSFQIPDSALLPIVQLAAAAPMWADRRGVIDTLVQAGLPVCVLPPRVSVHAGAPALRSQTGGLVVPAAVVSVLTEQLSSGYNPRMRVMQGTETVKQTPLGPFLCSAVDATDNVLKIPAPPEIQSGGEVTLEVHSQSGQVLLGPETIKLEPGMHLSIECSELGLPVRVPLYFTLSVSRLLRGPLSHQGLFWILPEDQRQACLRQLDAVSAIGSPLEQTLARASVLRSYGCWSASLHLLNTATRQVSGLTNRLPLFAAIGGIYDRMLAVLSQHPNCQVAATRLRLHQEVVWQLFHHECGAAAIEHHAAAESAARSLLRRASLSADAPRGERV